MPLACRALAALLGPLLGFAAGLLLVMGALAGPGQARALQQCGVEPVARLLAAGAQYPEAVHLQ